MGSEINKRVVLYRKSKGYTQSQMADLLNMKCNTYSQMERSGNITCDKIIEIAKILNVDVRILLYGEIKNKSIKIKPHEETKLNRYYHSSKLTDSEKYLIIVLRNLSKQKRDKCISFIENELKIK